MREHYGLRKWWKFGTDYYLADKKKMNTNWIFLIKHKDLNKQGSMITRCCSNFSQIHSEDNQFYVLQPELYNHSNYHSQQAMLVARNKEHLHSTVALLEILTGFSPSRRYLQLHSLPFFFSLLSSRCMPERIQQS